jgi:lipid II:glycine glycyltransferase (peptidoglycan interpeptide bridge formation enzyme)
MEKNNSVEIMQKNSPTGEFLQSEDWRKFQESVGRKTFHSEGENFWANIILHTLPVAGNYFYVPRGPILENQKSKIKNQNDNEKFKNDLNDIINLAKENKAGWIRIDPGNAEILENIKKNTKHKIVKAPHDMQPKEIFVIDITKSDEELLANMKPKTRYNIRLAEKKGVEVKISNFKFQTCLPVGKVPNQIQSASWRTNDKEDGYCIDEFIRLTAVMAKRQGITAHPAEYYRKMFQNISGDILKLYIAEYEGKIIVANLVIFCGETCIYLHGASDDNFRSVMAPYLLQWRQIQDAKKAGCVKYDFGGISTNYKLNTNVPARNAIVAGGRITNKWSGITKFKLGFSPKTLPNIFPGSYDIIIDSKKYWIYRILQKLKGIF